MKRLVALELILFSIVIIISACYGKEPLILENMKSAVSDAGYEGVEILTDLPENAVGGFTFIFLGAHGYMDIPILEFKDKASAAAYGEYINADENQLAIVNNKFLTIAEAHHGVAHAYEKNFLENLINGGAIEQSSLFNRSKK